MKHSVLRFVFVLFLKLKLVATARSLPATTQKLTSNTHYYGGNDDAAHASSVIRSDSDGGDGTIIFDATKRQLQNKITSNHLIRLEFSGVAYASISLNDVKEDLVNVIEDVLVEHLENGIEVNSVQRIDNIRKLRHSSSRMLSYILMSVRISLSHYSWISSERSLDTTIEILSEYVDKDFGDYMRNLPGNGDYDGTVDVREAYEDISVTVPTTPNPVSSPTQIPNGSFQFKLVFIGVSSASDLADSELFKNYISYAVTKLLQDNLDADVELVNVTLQPQLPEVWLAFPILISLQFSTSSGDAFANADNALNRIEDLDLYHNDYLEITSLSYIEKMELESALKEAFGEVDSVEINKKTSRPTQNPTLAPTNLDLMKPANDWLNKVTSDTMELPWWAWLSMGVGLALFAVCCCCVTSRFIIYRRAARRRKQADVTNIVHGRESDTHPTTDRYRATREEDAHTKSMYATQPNHFNETNQTMNEMTGRGELGNQDAGLDVYELNQSAPDPTEDYQEMKRKKKKKKKKKSKKSRDP